MQVQMFQCGKYCISLERDGRWLTITASAYDEKRRLLESVVNTVNGIMGEVLTDKQMESGKYDDSPWRLPTEKAAMAAFQRARGLFWAAPLQIEAYLNSDRAEGEWNYPDEEAK